MESEVNKPAEIGKTEIIGHLLIRDKTSGVILINQRDTVAISLGNKEKNGFNISNDSGKRQDR